MHKIIFHIFIVLLLTACGEPTPQLPPLKKDAVILAFGDSLTYGTGAKEGESYPAILEKNIQRKVIKSGIPGELSVEGLKRLPGMLEKHQPDLLILCHAGNDFLKKKSLTEAEANVRAMIKLASEKSIPVIMLGVPRPGLFLSDAELYENIAETTNIVYIPNLIADVLSDASMKSDPVHPNKLGYQKMAEIIEETLRKSGAI